MTMHIITAPLDPSLTVTERGALRDRLADDWRSENGSPDPAGVDLVPDHDA